MLIENKMYIKIVPLHRRQLPKKKKVQKLLRKTQTLRIDKILAKPKIFIVTVKTNKFTNFLFIVRKIVLD